jgi:hypothetical protein
MLQRQGALNHRWHDMEPFRSALSRISCQSYGTGVRHKIAAINWFRSKRPR